MLSVKRCPVNGLGVCVTTVICCLCWFVCRVFYFFLLALAKKIKILFGSGRHTLLQALVSAVALCGLQMCVTAALISLVISPYYFFNLFKNTVFISVKLCFDTRSIVAAFIIVNNRRRNSIITGNSSRWCQSIVFKFGE